MRFRLPLIAGLLLSFLLASCDVFTLTQESDILDGEWFSTVSASAGKCCNLNLTLASEDGTVTGEGTVETPGEGTGSVNEFSIAVEGTLTLGRINLSLVSDHNPGLIRGVVDRNYPNQNVVLRVEFEGFGYSGEDIILFPKPEEEQ